MKRLHLVSGAVILMAWAGSLIDGMASGDYQALTLVTPVMLIYAGYLFGDTLLRRRYADE